MRFENVLALSPHTDDVELGAGATLSRFAEEGSNIHFVSFSHPGETLREECREAIRVLAGDRDFSFQLEDFRRRHFLEHRQKILQWLHDYRKHVFEPDLVLTPSTFDLHQDHQVVTAEAQRAFKNVTIFGYILRWNCRSVREDVKVPLHQRHINAKLKALKCYASQEGKPYFNSRLHRSEAYVRGLNTKHHLAESFQLINLSYPDVK